MLIGFVGKPSVGKSSLFKAATLAEVEIANYPFTTIEKNEGVGFVKVPCIDTYFKVQCQPRVGYCLHHQRFVPVKLMDVAGLVKEAHLGKGRGNQFLDDLREADALIHVVDMAGATNEKGEAIEPGSYNPRNDILFLEVEIDLWYAGLLKKGWDRFVRQLKQERGNLLKSLAKQLSALKVTETMIEETLKSLNMQEDPSAWTEGELRNLATELRKKSKPILIAANKMNLAPAVKNLEAIREEFPDRLIIPCSAESEIALKEAARKGLIDYVPGEGGFTILQTDRLSPTQKEALTFIKDHVLDRFGSTGVQQVLDTAVFHLLGYLAIFPGSSSKLQDSEGRTLPDCFLLPPESTALDFAYSIHTDIGKNFVKAIDVKTKRPVGKDHVLKHLDVVEIMTRK